MSLQQLRDKARKDWENEEIEFVGDFESYFRGYIAAIKSKTNTRWNLSSPTYSRNKKNK